MSRTSVEAIVDAAAHLLETDGPEGMTMQAVAARVGVRAPSLYKHVGGRDALARLVAEQALADLSSRMDAAAPPGQPALESLRDVAHALRRFAQERPAAFRLIFAPGAEATRPDPEAVARSSTTVLRLAEELAGPEHALDAARTVTAWATGFLLMELSDAFRLGPGVDQAFAFGVDRLTKALTAR